MVFGSVRALSPDPTVLSECSRAKEPSPLIGRLDRTKWFASRRLSRTIWSCLTDPSTDGMDYKSHTTSEVHYGTKE